MLACSSLRKLIVFATMSMALPSFASDTSANSSSKIPEECIQAISDGRNEMAQLIASGTDFSTPATFGPILDEKLSAFDEDDLCRFYFSSGMFEMLTTAQQNIEAEYQLETMYKNEIGKNEKIDADLDRWYESRLRRLGRSDFASIQANRDSEAGRALVSKLVSTLKGQADRENKVVPFGRFAFVGRQAAMFTLYDFDRETDDSLSLDENGDPKLVSGSLQDAREKLLRHAVKIAQDFMEWRPALYFGEDSHMYGALWRSLGLDDSRSPREIKELSYFDQIRMIEIGLDRLKANSTPLLRLRSAMVKKSRAVLEIELQALRQTEIGIWAAPFVPVGMYVGGAMLAQTHWFAALPATTTSGTFVGGSLGSAANVSAGATAAVMLTTATAGAIAGVTEADQADGPFKFARVLDHMVHSVISSMPQAGLFPVQVGVTAYGAKQVFIGSRWMMSRGAHYYSAASKLGVSGTLGEIGRFSWQLPSMTLQLPQKFASHVIAAWWQQPKLMAVHYGADIVLTLIYEVGYRQFFLDGTSKFVYEDKDGVQHFNKQSLYSISSTLLLSPISKPITLIPSFAGRWLAYRGMTLFTSVVSHLIISGSVDEKRLAFDTLYFGTAGTAFGEVDRMFKMSDFVDDQPPHRQFALLILFKALLINPVERPLRIFLQDYAVGGNLSGLDSLRAEVAKYVGIDLNGFSDEELEMALTQAHQDVRAENNRRP